MPRPKVTLRLFLATIAGLALVSAGGAYLRLHWSLLPSNGRLPVPGLRAPVEVIRDRWGVPHIYAQREEDLFFAQGYVQAQDRLWQMEVCRRAAPTYRLIIDLAVGGRALAMNAGGQSGNPLSPHYADLIEPWRQGRYHPLLFERELILQASESSLTLAPAD